MKTKIINVNGPGEFDRLREAAETIKNGGLVVFPTETVYGLGADALNAAAVKKIYEAKGRPPDNPLIVHLAAPVDIYNYAEVPEIAGRIIKKFMPAPLTLVLKKKNTALDAVCKLDTIAVRVPKNDTARKLIELAGVPIAAPSANLSGRPSPTSAAHITADMDGRADMIICGGDCEIGLESTVIAFDCDGNVNILRSGHITREMLSGYGVRGAVCEGPPRSPGVKYAHYSPDAPLYILSGEDGAVAGFVKEEMRRKKTGFMCFDETLGYFPENENIISIGAKNDFGAQARNFFGALHKFNALGVDIIYSAEPQKTDVGEAVYNRLIKAAGGKIIKL